MKKIIIDCLCILFVAVVVLSAALIIGCSPSSADVYTTTSKAKWPTTTIEVHWVAKADITRVCSELGAGDSTSGGYAACARSKPNTISTCEIYTVQPEKFDDAFNINSLGHETWHCLGATHN